MLQSQETGFEDFMFAGVAHTRDTLTGNIYRMENGVPVSLLQGVQADLAFRAYRMQEQDRI